MRWLVTGRVVFLHGVGLPGLEVGPGAQAAPLLPCSLSHGHLPVLLTLSVPGAVRSWQCPGETLPWDHARQAGACCEGCWGAGKASVSLAAAPVLDPAGVRAESTRTEVRFTTLAARRARPVGPHPSTLAPAARGRPLSAASSVAPPGASGGSDSSVTGRGDFETVCRAEQLSHSLF